MHVVETVRPSLPASVTLSRFVGPSGVEDVHLVVRPTAYGSFAEQLAWVEEAYRAALEEAGLDPTSAVLRRFFCSDLPNQADDLLARPFSNPTAPDTPCGVSWICQPPLPPVKVSLWAWHLHDPAGPLDKTQDGRSCSVDRGELVHHFTCGLTCTSSHTSANQTRGVMADYEAFLTARELTWADHVARTWFFVQNVDANYQGLVTARRELFEERGLRADTHYVASTGIEGRWAQVTAKVILDAYAVSGLRPEQVTYLHALDHLSPTSLYGVTFERGTALDFADRRLVMISGTASIDRCGEIVWPGQVDRQLERTLENIGALLAQADATLADIGVFTVYLRDPADFDLAWHEMRRRFPGVPLEVVVAPVCRPGWLIEIECLAHLPVNNPGLPAW
ncbi:MAG: hypothetical protein IT204_16180 [Fimbriimonadaceae bacterium]|nr:hypothetical protein [Fimbriimonadaceae bacterium]